MSKSKKILLGIATIFPITYTIILSIFTVAIIDMYSIFPYLFIYCSYFYYYIYNGFNCYLYNTYIKKHYDIL